MSEELIVIGVHSYEVAVIVWSNSLQVIFGINPLLEALKSQKEGIEKVVIAEGRGGAAIQKILNLAEKRVIPVEFREKSYLDRQTGYKYHQGVFGLCKNFDYASVDEVIANRHVDFINNLILILDGITDPQNLGSLIRAAHYFGANGVIIPEHRAAAVTATVAKASAGAIHYIPIAMVVNLSNTIEYLKERGFWIYGTDPASGRNVGSIDYNSHIGLVMGGEGKGMRPLIKKKCDLMLSIPALGKIESLNVSVAAGIILYEILRAWGRV
ncbi:MAG TPA: 23S rRNA (guanosine(2251)-2'-O)-methyltransferase RlmB [Syntrophales bacterium]|nr:23S rRNA (guanosine(2251)-2'-O)-methyltransferase RlmB [Syntrophales bacterium]